MLNAEWRDLHPDTGSGPRRAPEAPWGIFCHGAHTWNGLALWDCGGGIQPRMLEAGTFPVRPVSRDILEDLTSLTLLPLDATVSNPENNNRSLGRIRPKKTKKTKHHQKHSLKITQTFLTSLLRLPHFPTSHVPRPPFSSPSLPWRDTQHTPFWT